MSIVNMTEVEPLAVRPAVIVNPRSYYLEPRVKRIETTTDEITIIYEQLMERITGIKSDVTATNANVRALNESIESISGDLEVTSDQINDLSTRVGSIESSNSSITAQVNSANSNAVQALNKANSMTESIVRVTELAEQNALAIANITFTTDLTPATVAEINAVCT